MAEQEKPAVKEEKTFNPHLETKESLQKELQDTRLPITMYKKAIEILARMERNFGDALGNDPQSRFDGNLDDADKTDFEKKAHDLKNRASEVIKNMSVAGGLHRLAQIRLGHISMNTDAEIDGLIKELLEVQAKSKQDIETDFKDDGKLNWKKHVKSENEDLPNRMKDIASELGIKSIGVFVRPESKEARAEDQDKGLKFASTLRYAIQKLGNNDPEFLKTCGIILCNPSVKNNLSKTGSGQIIIDYEETPEEIVKDIQTANNTMMTGLNNALDKINQKFASLLCFWPHLLSAKGRFELIQNLPKVEQALGLLNNLDPEEKALLKNTKVVLHKEGKEDLLEYDNGEKLIVVGYNSTPMEMAAQIKKGLEKMKGTVTALNNSLDKINEKFGSLLCFWPHLLDTKERYALRQNLPKVEQALGLLNNLDPEEKALLKDTKVVLHTKGREDLLEYDNGEKLIVVEYNSTPMEMAAQIKKGLEKMKGTVTALNNSLDKINQKFGSLLCFWPHLLNTKGRFELVQNLPKVEQALDLLNNLDPTEKTLLKDTKVVLHKEGKKGFLEYENGERLIVVGYNSTPREMATQIKTQLDILEKSTLPLTALDPRTQLIKLPQKFRDERTNQELQLMIARNLFDRKEEVNEQNILKEFQRIMEERETYGKIPLFSQRHVLYVANNEKLSDSLGKYGEKDITTYEKTRRGEDRFGTRATLDNITKQGGALEDIKVARKLADIKRDKEKIMTKIKTTPPPFTFIFDGHGDNSGISLDRNSGNENTGLDTREIATCITERYHNFPQLKEAKPEEKDIFVFISCKSHNFLRNLDDQLKGNLGNFSYPILLSTAEYNQFGYSDFPNPYGDKYFSDVMDMKSGHTTTLGTIMKNETLNQSNPSLFIPSDGGTMRQISQKEQETDHNRKAA